MKINLGPWKRIDRGRSGDILAAQTGAPGLRFYQREVPDGHLTVIAGCERSPGWDGPKWHLSISHRTNEDPPKPGRYPAWDEITDAKDRFIPADVTMAMLLPPRHEWVNLHHTTFHLWQITGEAMPS